MPETSVQRRDEALPDKSGVSMSSISLSLEAETCPEDVRFVRYSRQLCNIVGSVRSPVIQADEHMLVVLRYIEANPLRASMVTNPGDYRWSSYQYHGLGRTDALLSPFPEWQRLGPTEAERRRRWRAKFRASQREEELKAVRASVCSGRPLGRTTWIEHISRRLGIDPHPRPRGRPRKEK